MKKVRILQLDGARVFMCLVVVIAHFGFLKSSSIGTIYENYFQRGSLAVDFFFILSGFGIYCSSQNVVVDCGIKKSLKYAISKIEKIYALYILSLIFGIFFQVPVWINSNFAESLNLIVRIIGRILQIGLCLSLLQSMTGIMAFNRAINGVCWFLSTLFVSYMFCPLFLKVVNKCDNIRKIIIAIVCTITIILVLSFIAYSIDVRLLNSIKTDLFYTFPFIRCLYLLLGMLLSKLAIINKYEIKKPKFLTFLVVVFYLVYFFGRSTISNALAENIFRLEILRILDILLTGLLIYTLSCGKGLIIRILKSSVFVKLSRYSMHVFLFHEPVISLLKLIYEKFQLFSFGIIAYVGFGLLTIVFTILIVKLSIKLEPPLSEKLSTYLFKPLKLKLSEKIPINNNLN